MKLPRMKDSVHIAENELAAGRIVAGIHVIGPTLSGRAT